MSTFSELIDFTRSSTGTYLGSDGLIKTANVDEPRLEYDASGQPLGLLIEEQRTNLALNSVNASSDNATTNVTQTANQANSLTGTDDAFLLQANTTGTSYSGQSTSVTSGTSYTASRFVKAGASNFAQLSMGTGGFGNQVFANFDLNTGTVAQESNCVAVMTNMGSGWYRCSISAQAVSTVIATSPHYFSAVNSGTALIRTSEAGNSVYFYGSQTETGAFPTSYIPTSGSTVTRNADFASASSFKYHQNSAQGTLYAEFTPNIDTVSFKRVAELGYSNLRFSIQVFNSEIRNYTRNAANNTNNVIGTPYSYTPYRTQKSAFTVSSGYAAKSDNGTDAQSETDVFGLNESNVGLYIGGSSSGAQLNGHIKRLQYFPTKLSNDKLVELTKPSSSPTMSLTFDGQSTSELVEGLHD